ncbi:MAG: flippase [bacterium]|nr:flippase [bacterium]
MLKMKSIKVNVILNFIKTLMGVIFPLITFPYVARILQANYLGKVTYAQSIVSYFALIAALGISTYAVREGAKIRENKYQLQQFANEVFTINIITTIGAYILLAILLLIVKDLSQYSKLILLLSSSILFTTIGVDWLNVIFEDYFVITIRSICIQVLNLVLLFIFVKNERDYYIYAFLTVFSQIIICIWNFFYCRKYIKVRVIIQCKFLKHIKPLLIFFSNNLAVTIYCYADSTMIGWLVSDYCVGIYSVAVKVYTILKTLLASVFAVCIPRLSFYYGNNDQTNFRTLLNSILSCLILVLLPAMTGLIVLAKPIIMFLGGSGYQDAILTLRILSVALVFAIVGGIFTNCANIPMGKEKINLRATIIAAILNVSLNFFMIPIMKQNGAAITTVLAEISVVVICLLSNQRLKTVFDWNIVFRNSVHAILESTFIIVLYFIMYPLVKSEFLLCVIIVVCSLISYIFLLIILKNPYIYILLRKAEEIIKNKQKRN